MTNENLKNPFRSWTESRKPPVEFELFRLHCQPLNIKAKGKVMIIGPSVMGDELALLEADIPTGPITEIVMSSLDDISNLTIPYFNQLHPEVNFTTTYSYNNYFDNNPTSHFDTMLFIGIPLQHPEDTIKSLNEHLNPNGNIYLTINAIKIPVIPQIDRIQCKIIPDLPPHPYYNLGQYYGVVATKNNL